MAKGIIHGKENPFISYVRRRLKKGFNFVGLCAGGVGTGKTYCALSICEHLAKISQRGKKRRFPIKFDSSWVAFNSEQFVRLVRKANKGQCIVYDESGVGINSRNFFREENKGMSYIMQTFRLKQLVVFFTVPAMRHVDSQVRSMFQASLTPISIDREKKICKVKVVLIKNNPLFEMKPYSQYLRIWRKGQGYLKMKHINVGMPSKLLCKEYEVRKVAFADQLYKDINMTLEKTLEKDLPTAQIRKPKLTLLQEKIYDLRLKGMNTRTIAQLMGTSESNIGQHLTSVRKKGYETNLHKLVPPTSLPAPQPARANLNYKGDTPIEI